MSDPAAKPSRVVPVAAALGCGLAFVLLLLFYGNASRGYVNTPSLFWWWISQWLDPRAESEHGWLILAISGWLFWRALGKAKRRESRAESEGTTTRSSQTSALSIWPAFVAMSAGLIVHLAGFAAQQARLSIVAFLVFVWGVLRLAGGKRWSDAAMFPLAFLLFAIPINVLDSIGFWLRMWVIEASSTLAHAAGIDVIRSGTQLLAPDGRYNYDVAAACSGVRSLTALAALSLLIGYLNFRSWGRRVFVLLLCFPLVYIGNVARIASIIFAAQLGGPKWGDTAHDVMGYGIFVIVLGGVLGAVTIMEKWWPEGAEGGTKDLGPRTEDLRARTQDLGPRTEDPEPTVAEHGDRSEVRGPGSRVLGPKSSATATIFLAGAIVGLALAEAVFLNHLATSPERGSAGVALSADGVDPVELPTFVGTDWIGKRTPVTAVEREILPEDTGFSRKIYVSLAEAKREVLLSIVLSGRDRTSIHRPELCLVGQGWTILDATRQGFRFPATANGAFPATLLALQREVRTPKGTVVEPYLAAYWFVDSDRIVASHWQRILRDAWNRVTRARADRWAYVLMQTDARDGQAAALARMQTVIDGTLPAFLRVNPGR